METRLADFIKDTPLGDEADKILRACVHCGFCTATCPTYQLLGDELDGPRGRIYQIKLVLEGHAANRSTQTHLDRCLTCRSCETTCPSGVEYGKLLDIGREQVAQQVPRPFFQRGQRWALRKLIGAPVLFQQAMKLGRLVRPLLPSSIKAKILPAQQSPELPIGEIDFDDGVRRVIVVQGCVQPTYKPATNAALTRVLFRLGVEVITVPSETCCGAVSQHLDAPHEAKQNMRVNIDAWWPIVEKYNVEAIISTASGCGVLIKDYSYHLRDDPNFAKKAEKISELTFDVAEFIEREDLSLLNLDTRKKVAFQSPCTLQHGQKLSGNVEAILKNTGFKLVNVSDSHLCCGSAGTYSVLQKTLSNQLKENKLNALEENQPEIIATANIGCQLHLETKASRPVCHWIELLDDPSEQL